MKENDIITLSNLKAIYKCKNLYKGVNGIVLKPLAYNKSLVLFLNDNIIGDYAVVEVENSDLKKEEVKLPIDFIAELKKSNKLSEQNLFKKQAFENVNFRECEMVELLVEDDKYSKYGIHKGDTGVIALDYAVQGYVLVDFSGIDEDGNYFGDCISVKVNDLKIIK